MLHLGGFFFYFYTCMQTICSPQQISTNCSYKRPCMYIISFSPLKNAPILFPLNNTLSDVLFFEEGKLCVGGMCFRGGKLLWQIRQLYYNRFGSFTTTVWKLLYSGYIRAEGPTDLLGCWTSKHLKTTFQLSRLHDWLCQSYDYADLSHWINYLSTWLCWLLKYVDQSLQSNVFLVKTQKKEKQEK